MPYALGVDVGTSHTAAAVCHLDGSGWSSVQTMRLQEHRDTVESALWLAADGAVVVGDQAAQRTVIEHRRMTRGFVARVGDDVPVVIGGEQYLAEELTAALVNWVVDGARAQLGDAPAHIVVTHPADWGGYRRGLLHGALHRAGLANVTLLPRPVAAAEGHAARVPVEAGALLAIHHLGGETLEVSVVRLLDSGVFALLGHLESTEPAGGVCFDDVLLEQLQLDCSSHDGDAEDPHSRLAAWALRRDCTAAKELLSGMTEVSVRVRSREVRVARARFEEAIAPRVQHSVQTLLQCVRSVGSHPGQLASVVLVGGSARIPLVGHSVAASVPCRIAIDEAPETAVARGAAVAALKLLPGAGPAPAALPGGALPGGDGGPGGGLGGGPGGPGGLAEGSFDSIESFDERFELGHCLDLDPTAPPPRPAVRISPLELPERRSPADIVSSVSGGRPAVVGALATVFVALGVGLTLMFSGGGDQTPAPGTGAKPVQSVSRTIPSTTPATEQVSDPSAAIPTPTSTPSGSGR